MLMVRKSRVTFRTPGTPGACGRGSKQSQTPGLLHHSVMKRLASSMRPKIIWGRLKALNDTFVRKATPHHNDMYSVLNQLMSKGPLTESTHGRLQILTIYQVVCSENVCGTCHLAHVFTDIYKTSLSLTVALSCLKTTTIIPVPKNLQFHVSMTTDPYHSLPS